MHELQSTEPYRQRLCRAVGLATIGAAMHVLLPPQGGALPVPAIIPVKLAQAELLLPVRALWIEHALVLARPAVELERRFGSTAREPGPVGMMASGRTETVSPLLPVDLRPLPEYPLPSLTAFINGRAAESDGEVIQLAIKPTGDEALSNTPDESKHTAPSAAPGPTEVTVSAAAEPIEPLTAASVTPVSARTPLDLNLNEEELVRRLLDEYTGAFERLDVGATKAVWPSVNGKALERAYGQLSAQRLTLQSCGITISGSTANARCRGSASYQPRIGRRTVEIASREWMFDLSKKDTAWRIVNTFVR